MNELKEATLKEENIVQTQDGYFRYVNHQDGLATTGFRTRIGLLMWTANIRFDDKTVELMKARYMEVINVQL